MTHMAALPSCPATEPAISLSTCRDGWPDGLVGRKHVAPRHGILSLGVKLVTETNPQFFYRTISGHGMFHRRGRQPTKQEKHKMGMTFPLEVETLDVPFAVVPNAAFPDATPVCVLTNNGHAPAFDTFIKTYVFPGFQPPFGTKEGSDPWQVEFRWQTKGGGSAGAWVLDAWLEG